MDYAALAKQYGGSTAAPAVDYAALAKQYGGSTASASPTNQPEKQGFLGKVGSGLASLADTTIGGVLPMAGQVVQAASRPFTTPQRAEELGGVVSSALEKPFGKTFGVTDTPAYKQESSRQLMDFIGANISKGADWIANTTGLPVEDVRNMLGTSLLAAPAAVKGTANLGVKAVNSPMGQTVIAAQSQAGNAIAERMIAPMARRASIKGAQNLADSYQNASQIEAAQAAQRMGAALDPAVSNPTTGNVVKGALTGTSSKQASLAKINEGVWVKEAKKVIGAEENSILDAKAFDAALDKVNRPLDPIKSIVMQPTDKVVAALESARIPEQIGGKSAVATVDALVNQAQQLLSEGRSGQAVLDDIRQLRRNANSIQQSQKVGMAPDPAKMAEAEASLKIASALEQLIDANAPDAKTLDAVRGAREKSAQIFDVERATNKTTGRVDPLEFAKMINEGKKLTGPLRDMGMVAGNFPSIAVVDVNAAPRVPSISRSGPAGTMGYAVGTASGMSPSATATVGSGIGGVIGGLAARRIAKPEYQAANAVPRDYRPPINNLRPVEPAYSPNQPVPYDYSQSSFVPPNFVMQPNQYGPRVTTPGFAPGPAQLPAPSAQGTMNMLRTEDARRAAMSRTLGQQAEQQAAAAEAAARRPTSGAVEMQINPLTGVPEISKGLKGATPEIIESANKAAMSAAEKVRTGRMFDMTAAEKIQWNKSWLEGMPAEQGPMVFGKLTPDQIANKMQDRAFVQQAINTAQDKARAFQDIAARAQSERLRQDALVKREQMLDLLENLEAQFSKARPVKTGGQGPKTRAFQRNMLRPEGEEIQNALVK